MLRSIKDHSGSWFIKVIFGIIAASFAFFGVGDMIRSTYKGKGVATVGGEKITLEHFKHRLQETINRIQASTNELVKPELLETLGIPKQILNGMIQEELLKHFLHKSKLTISDKALKNQVQTMDVFKNESGRFDKTRFDAVLQNAGMNEDLFLKDIKEKLMLQQVLGPLSRAYALPSFYLQRIFEALYTSYDFAYITIPLSKVKVIKEIATGDLEAFYSQNLEVFRKKEQRAVDFVVVEQKNLAEGIDITPQEILSRFEERKADFTHPQKRYVQVVKCLTQELAQDARLKILAKERVNQVAKDVKASLNDLGEIEKSSLKPELSDVIFALEPMTPSDPVLQGQEWHIYVVTQITPETTEDFEKVKDKLFKEILFEKAQDALNELRTKLEDKVAFGEPLETIAKEFNLKVISKKNIEAGVFPSDDTLSPHQKALGEKIIACSQGKVSDVIDLEGGAIALLEVKEITPSFVPEFEIAKEEVKKFYNQEQQLQTLSKDLEEWTLKRKSVTALDQLAKTYGVTTKDLKKVSRITAEKNETIKENLSSPLVSQMFSLPSQDYATFGRVKDGFVVVLKVKKNELKAKTLEKEYEKFTQNMTNMTAKDFEGAFVQALHQDYLVEIDEKAIEGVLKRD